MDRIGKLTAMAVIGLFLAGLCTAAPDRIIYVDGDARGTNDGTSWANAFPFLQDALAAARADADVRGEPKPVEIRIAKGVYRPDQGAGAASGNRETTFNIPNGAVLKGGYFGGGPHTFNSRNPQLYRTILSGDLKGNDADDGDVKNLASDPTRSDNSIYVITSRDNSSATVLDGLVITGGTRAGLSCIDSSLVVIDCVFIRNSTTTDGGALRQEKTGSPALTRCTFTANWARQFGGALYIEGGITLTDCVFTSNCAQSGGAISGRFVLGNCLFENNTAETGGAARSDCLGPGFVNCTFFANRADDGICIALGPCGIRSTPEVTMTSCILWESGSIAATPATKAVAGAITYSLIQGGWPGDGNIDTGPHFAAPGHWDPNGTRDNPDDDVWISSDYHLKSQAGRWDPAGNKWVQDDVTSPCIDAGDPQAAIGLEPFPNGGAVNMGVFGGTAEASKSYFGKPPCPTIIAGDINGDCKVNMADLDILMRHWLEGGDEPEPPRGRR